MPITRLAPSPTGALHLGNARTFLINWLLARQNHWQILLRIEDLDSPRIKRGADQQAIDDLRWLGLDWDDGPIYQSARRDRYRAAVDRLLQTGAAYPCICTRREIELAASAPHSEDGSTRYPGTCRDRFASLDEARAASGREPAIRFDTRGKSVEFEDRFSGMHRFDVDRQLGDFVIAKGDGTPAYQLAVVIDDAETAVSEIVRGDDLLDSTPRQILIYRALGMEDRIPRYTHVPLVVGSDGRRLAKRHGDTRLSSFRDAGVRAAQIMSLLARWCGIDNPGSAVAAADLIGRFDLMHISRQPIVFEQGSLVENRLESPGP